MILNLNANLKSVSFLEILLLLITTFAAGASAPVESDVKIFETFFEKAVAPLGNEFAIISFLTVCRISSWPVFVAFARLMQAHMVSNSVVGFNSILFRNLCPTPAPCIHKLLACPICGVSIYSL